MGVSGRGTWMPGTGELRPPPGVKGRGIAPGGGGPRIGGRFGDGPLVGRGFKGAFDKQLRGTTPLLVPSRNSHRAC